MGTGIGYRNEARPQMKGRYGTGKICTCLTSLIRTTGGEFPVCQRNANHNYAYTHLQQILSQDSSRTSVHFVPCTGVMLGENSYLELTRNYEDDLTLVLRGLKLRGKAQVYLNINKNFGFS